MLDFSVDTLTLILGYVNVRLLSGTSHPSPLRGRYIYIYKVAFFDASTNDSAAEFDIESDSRFLFFKTCFITHTQTVESVICSGITCWLICSANSS